MYATSGAPTARRRQHAFVPGAAILLSLMLAHCGGGGGGDGDGGGGGSCDQQGTVSECDVGSPCVAEEGYARVCEDAGNDCSGECVNVCDRPGDFADNSVPTGGTCEFDADCEGVATCDNDEVGDSSCRCVTRSTCANRLDVAFSDRTLPDSCEAAVEVKEVGGTPGRWKLSRTCRRVDGTCTRDNDDIGLGMDFTDNTDVCWVDDNYRRAAGRLCASDFSFRENPIIAEYDTGVFHFTSNTEFDAEWIVYSQPGGRIVARCTGNGRASSVGAPDPSPDCNDYRPFGN